MGVCATRHWQTSGWLLQEFNVWTEAPALTISLTSIWPGIYFSQNIWKRCLDWNPTNTSPFSELMNNSKVILKCLLGSDGTCQVIYWQEQIRKRVEIGRGQWESICMSFNFLKYQEGCVHCADWRFQIGLYDVRTKSSMFSVYLKGVVSHENGISKFSDCTDIKSSAHNTLIQYIS